MSIAKQDWEQFLNQARIKLTGASDNGIKSELYSVLQEFFDISSCWQERLYIDALAAQVKYALVPDEGQIIRLGGAVGSNEFANKAAFLAAGSPHTDNWSFVPSIMPEFGELILANPANKPQLLRVTVIKNVSRPTTRDMVPLAPDWLLPKYEVYILDGLLGKMMAQPKKSYTDDGQSTYHLRRFEEGKSRARTAALNKNTYGNQAWSFPRFGGGSQKGYMSVGNSRGF